MNRTPLFQHASTNAADVGQITKKYDFWHSMLFYSFPDDPIRGDWHGI